MSGEQVLGVKVLTYADESADFSPDSLVLVLANGDSLTFTVATDWTLRVERGIWPALPAWAWPPDRWRYEDFDSPIGNTGFTAIQSILNLHNEVGEVVGAEITFASGTVRLTAGESIAYELLGR